MLFLLGALRSVECDIADDLEGTTTD